MVLTGPQTTAFFENNNQMGIPHDTVVQMGHEGITEVSDLAEFDKDSLQLLADNLRRPGGRVPDPNPGAPAGSTIPTPAFVFGVKSHRRLLVATDLVKFYDTVGRALTPANIQWNSVMKNFEIQWKALKEKQRDEDTPDVPKITKTLPVLKWTEAFQDFLSRVIGVRTVPLSYVIREHVDVPAAAPALAAGQPHSTEHGSVEAELVARASHNHASYRDDNKAVYHYLEEATRSTQYAPSLKPFQRRKDGRGAWLAIVGQYAGNDKWEAEIKRQEQLIHTRKWKGQSNFSLESFVSQHRNAFVSLQACAEHVTYQLPNEHSRVGYLLEGIENSDAGLQAAIASIRTDTGPTGKRNDFEATAAHLLPYCPVAKKRQSNKRPHGFISDVAGVQADAANAGVPKASIGKTGVHLRFYKDKEYKALSPEQKKELREWRLNNPNEAKAPKLGQGKGKGSGKKQKFYTQSQVDSLVTKKIKAALEEKQEKDDDDAYIMSIVKKAVLSATSPATTSAVTAPTDPTPPTLKSILRRARNGGKS